MELTTEQLENCFTALKSADRLRLLALISTGKSINVGELANILSISPPLCSHHISTLKHASLIIEHKSGKYKFFSLNVDFLKQLAEFLLFRQADVRFSDHDKPIIQPNV